MKRSITWIFILCTTLLLALCVSVAAQAENQNVFFTLEPEPDGGGVVRITTSDRLRYELLADDAAAVRVRWRKEESSESDADSHPFGECANNLGFDEPGRYWVYAEVSYDYEHAPWFTADPENEGQYVARDLDDEEWDEIWDSGFDFNSLAFESVRSVSVEVEEPAVYCGDFSFELASNSCARGDNLTVSFTESENADRYHIRVFPVDSEEEVYFREVYSSPAVITTGTLEPGDYFVDICSGGGNLGWAGGDCENPELHINPLQDASQSFFRASFSDGDFTICHDESFTVSIYKKDAFAVRMIADNNEEDVWGEWGGEFGGYGEYSTEEYYFEYYYSFGEHTFTAQYKADENSGWEDFDSLTLDIVQPGGWLEKPEVILENVDCGVLPADTDLRLTVSTVPNSGAYNIAVFVEDDDECIYERRKETLGPDEALIPFCVPANRFRANCVYRVEAWVDGNVPGFMSGWADDARFVVAPPKESNPLSFSLEPSPDGETGEINVRTNQTIRFDLFAEGAAAVRVWTGREWDCTPFDAHDGDFCLHEPGRYPVFAQACYDYEHTPWFRWDDETQQYVDAELDEEQWDEIWEGENPFDINDLEFSSTTDIIWVNVSAYDASCEDFEYRLDTHNAARGKNVLITLEAESSNAERYHVRLYPEYSYEEAYFCEFYKAPFVITTGTLEPGDYTVEVIAGAEGFDWMGGDCEDPILHIGEPQSDAFFLASAEDGADILFGADFTVSIYKKDAFAVRMIADSDQDDVWGYWDGEYGGFGGNGAETYSWDPDYRPGPHTLIAQYQAEQDGDWTDISAITMNVCYGDERLEKPSIKLNNVSNGLLPAETALSLSVVCVPKGCNYNVKVSPADEYWSVYRKSKRTLGPDEVSIPFTVPADCFEPDHVYRVEAWVDTDEPGYDSSRADSMQFYVAGVDEGNVVLTLLSDNNMADASTPFVLTASAPGAAALYLFGGVDYASDYFSGDYAVCDFKLDDVGDYILYALACYDSDIEFNVEQDGNYGVRRNGEFFTWEDFRWEELDWSVRSNLVTLTVNAAEDELTLPDYKVPPEVVMGDFLEFDIPVTGMATEYDVKIREAVPNGEFDGQGNPEYDYPEHFYISYSVEDAVDGLIHARIPTGSLSTDAEYGVVLRVSAPGYSGTEIDYHEAPHFIVTKREQSEPLFEVAAERVPTWTGIAYTLYVPDAIETRLVSSDGNDNWGTYQPGNASSGTIWSGGRSDVLCVIAQARFTDSEEGVWTTIGTRYIEVVASNEFGPDDITVSGIPSRVKAGEILDINVSTLNVSQISFHVNEALDYNNVVYSTEDIHGNRSRYLVNTSVFEPGNTYVATVDVMARGYAQKTYVYGFCVEAEEPSYDTSVVFTVNGQSEDLDVSASEDVSVCIQAPADAIATRLYASGWNNHRYWPGNTLEDEIYTVDGYIDAGAVVLYAQAGYGNVDFNSFTEEDWENFDWEHDPRLEWGQPSQPITLRIQPAEGSLDVRFHLVGYDGMGITRGKLLQVHLDNPVDIANYRACIIAYDDDELRYNDVTEWYEWDGTGSIFLPTGMLPEGEYGIAVEGSGLVGWSEGSYTIYDAFNVLPNTEPVAFSVSSNEFFADRGFTLSGYAPGAVKIEVLDTDNSVYFSWENDNFDVFWGIAKGEYDLLVRATNAAGNTAESQVEHIKVKSAGNLETPNVLVPRGMYNGWTLPVEIYPMANVDWGYSITVFNSNGEMIYFEKDDQWDGGTTAYLNLENDDNGGYLFEGGGEFAVKIDCFSSAFEDSSITLTTRFVDDSDGLLVLPASLGSIEAEAFMGVSGPCIVRIPSGVTSIGSKAFANCSGLCIVEIPDSVQTIADDAFDPDSRLVFHCHNSNSSAAIYGRSKGFYVIYDEA